EAFTWERQPWPRGPSRDPARSMSGVADAPGHAALPLGHTLHSPRLTRTKGEPHHAHSPSVAHRGPAGLRGRARPVHRGNPSSTPTTNPRGESTGSMTTLPGPSGTGTVPGANRGGEPMTPPTSNALGTTPTPEAILADLHMANVSEVELGKVAEQRAQ